MKLCIVVTHELFPVDSGREVHLFDKHIAKDSLKRFLYRIGLSVLFLALLFRLPFEGRLKGQMSVNSVVNKASGPSVVMIGPAAQSQRISSVILLPNLHCLEVELVRLLHVGMSVAPGFLQVSLITL